MVGQAAAGVTVVGGGGGGGGGGGVGVMITLPPVPGEAISSAPQAASAAQDTPIIKTRLIFDWLNMIKLPRLPGSLNCWLARIGDCRRWFPGRP